MHSFTQETTYYGREKEEGDPPNIDYHMNVQDFKVLGVDLAKVIAYYLNSEFTDNLEAEAIRHK